MIDKIGGITPLNTTQNTTRATQSQVKHSDGDSIDISQEAYEAATNYYMTQVAAETPDVRADRVAEVRAKLADPNYLNEAVIASTADKIMSAYGV